MGRNMQKEVANEIIAIKNELEHLARRVSRLERSQTLELASSKSNTLESVEPVGEPRQSQQKEEAAIPLKQTKTDVVFDNKVVIKKSDEVVQTSKTKTQKQRVSNLIKKESSKEELIPSISLEEKIGSYLLNRIGIASLVIGLAFLLMYSFQFYGPFFKAFTGFAIALSLVAFGEWMNFKGQPKWYARGLIGGGWSIMFFTTYALYHVEPVKLIDNFMVDWILMLGVSAASMFHALYRKSETIAGLSMVLSLISLGLGAFNSFAWIASTILVCSLAYLAIKLDWYRLYFWGVLGAFSTFYLGINPDIGRMNLSQLSHCLVVASYISIYWVVFSLTSLYLKDYSSNRKNRLVIGALVSTFGFVPYMSSLVSPLLGKLDFLFPTLIGVAYLAMYFVARQKQLRALLDLNLLVGVLSLTYTISMVANSSSCNVYWMLEIPLLIYLGIKYRIKSLKVFAVLLSIPCSLTTLGKCFSTSTFSICGINFLEGTLHVSAACLSFGLSSLLAKNPSRFMNGESKLSKLYYPYFLATFGFAYILPLVGLHEISYSIFGLDASSVKEVLTITFYALLNFSVLLMGIKFNTRFESNLSCFATLALTLLIILASKYLAIFTLMVVLLSLLTSTIVYRALYKAMSKDDHSKLYHTYLSSLAFYVWALAITVYPSEFLALRWSIEAITFVAVGFWFSDRGFRLAGELIFSSSVLALLSCSYFAFGEVSTVILLLYVAAILYRVIPKASNMVSAAQVYEVAAAFLLTLFIGKEVNSAWMTLAWSVEGFCLLLAGFALKDKPFRVSGLLVFLLVAMKLLFIDLAGAETIARILSFIAAGLTLLIASYVYTRFAHHFISTSKEEAN